MITQDQKYDLLCSAIEGGSNYWYSFEETACDIVYLYEGDTFMDRLWAALLDGRFIPVHDIEDGSYLGDLSMMGLDHAKILMQDKYPYHYADAATDNGDCITGDVFFQLAVMKDVIYG